MPMDNIKPSHDVSEQRNTQLGGAFGAGHVTTRLIQSTGATTPHLEFKYFKSSAVPLPHIPPQTDDTQDQDLKWDRSRSRRLQNTCEASGDRQTEAASGGGQAEAIRGRRQTEATSGSGQTGAAKKREVFRSISQPQLNAADCASRDQSCSSDGNENDGIGKPSSPDVIPVPEPAGAKPKRFNLIKDMTDRNDSSLVGSDTDTDTPFFDPQANRVDSTERSSVKKYKSQQSTPNVISNDTLEMMRKPPSYLRSKSHPAIERQITPEDFEFVRTSKERRELYSYSSGYHTASKGSTEQSTDRTMDAEDADRAESPADNAHTSGGSTSEQPPLNDDDVDAEISYSDEGNDSTFAESTNDIAGHGGVSFTLGSANRDDGGNNERDRILQNPVHERLSQDGAEFPSRTNEEIMYNDQLPTVLGSAWSSPVGSPTASLYSSLTYQSEELSPNMIPTVVALHSVTPPGSIHSSVSESISLELQAAYYLNDIEHILEQPLEIPANLQRHDTIESGEIEDDFVIPPEILLETTEDARCQSVDHDRLALSIITSDAPSLDSMRCYYDGQICEGRYYTDEELNGMLSDRRAELQHEHMISMLRDGFSTADIEQFYSQEDDATKCTSTEDDVFTAPGGLIPRDVTRPEALVEVADGGDEVDGADDAQDDDIETDFAGSPPESPLWRTRRHSEAEAEEVYEVGCLQMAALCNDTTCSILDCLYGKRLHDILEKMVQVPKTGVPSQRSVFCRDILEKICSHSRSCDKLNCGVPLCRFFYDLTEEEEQDEDGNRNTCFADHMMSFKREYLPSVFGTTTLLINESEAQFEKFEDEGYDSMPVEEHDYRVLTRLGAFKDVFLATHLTPPAYSIIKRRKTRTESLAVLRELRHLNVRHDSVIRHQWGAHTCSRPSLLLTSAPYMGIDLKSELRKSINSGGFSSEMCSLFMKQLESVLSYLHDPKRGIMYLNWSSEHILLVRIRDVYRLVLFNFDSSSTLMRNKKEVGENLLDYLPPMFVPPEVQGREEVVFPQSDYWGAGCLLYELCSGLPLYHHVAHLSFHNQKTHMLNHPVPSVATAMSKGMDIFFCLKNLLRVNPLQRRFDCYI